MAASTAWWPLASSRGHEVSGIEFYVPVFGKRLWWVEVDVDLQDESAQLSEEELVEVLAETSSAVTAFIAERGLASSRICLPSGVSLASCGRQLPLLLFRFRGAALAAAARPRPRKDGEDPDVSIVASTEADYDAWKVAMAAFLGTQNLPTVEAELPEEVLRDVWVSFQESQAPASPVGSGLSVGSRFVARGADGAIEGFAEVSAHPARAGGRVAFMNQLWVDSSRHRGGRGTALVSRVAAWALEHGLDELRWFCIQHNTAGVSFYRAVGAEVATDNVWQFCA